MHPTRPLGARFGPYSKAQTCASRLHSTVLAQSSRSEQAQLFYISPAHSPRADSFQSATVSRISRHGCSPGARRRQYRRFAHTRGTLPFSATLTDEDKPGRSGYLHCTLCAAVELMGLSRQVCSRNSISRNLEVTSIWRDCARLNYANRLAWTTP